MLQSPKIGTTLEQPFQVESTHAITFDEQQMSPVLSTPWLIWFLEHAALNAVEPYLDANECTLGVHVSLDHLAPTPIGQIVRCIARVIQVDGTLITFQVEAFDEQERIARGIHKRQVVPMDRFSKRVNKKSKSS